MDLGAEQLVEQLFQQLADLPTHEREAAFRARSGIDPHVQERVLRLLALHDAACDPGLHTPVIETPSSSRSGPDSLNRVGPYQIVRVLGEGGMGTVYLARQEELIHREVALKVIKLGMDTRAVLTRFEAEREALAMMNHPNVARVLDAGTTQQGRPYFVMEYVEGVPITQFCDEKRLALSQRVQLYLQVCQAVQHAHQKGIIHRDLKPSNVLVTITDGQPVPKVIDFGIAKATQQKLTDQTFATERGLIVGTPAYMSPEQADPMAADIDTRADIYSLGVILYEMLVGVLPLDPDSMRKIALSEVQRLIREVDPLRPSSRLDEPASAGGSKSQDIARFRQADPKSLMRQIRGELDWIVMKCLEKDRTRRYETANALAMDLQRYLNHEPVVAGPPSRAYRVRKFVRRYRAAVLTSALMVLLIVGSAIGMTALYFRAEAQRRIAESSERHARQEAERADREANQARRERQKAERSSNFLSDILRAAGPSVAQGRDSVMLREMLDGAARRIEEGELKDAPEAELTLRRIIGATYSDLGVYDRAAELAAPSISLSRSLYGNEHLEVARSLQYSADIAAKQGKNADCEAHLREALAIDRSLFGEENEEVGSVLTGLGDVLLRAGKYAEAEAVHRDALAIFISLFGEEHYRVATSLNNLGTVLDRQGQFQEAERLYRQSLEMRWRLLGEEHVETMTPLNNLASVLERLGRTAEGEVLQRKNLALKRKVYGNEHPRVATTLNNLGVNLNRQGKFAEAEEVFREALDMRLRLLGEEHPDVATSMNNLAGVLSQTGEYAQAEDLSRKVLALDRKLLGDEHPLVAGNLRSLSVVLERQGKYEEAEGLARESLQLCEAKLPADSRERFLAGMALGAALTGLGRYAEAEQLLLEAQQRLQSRTDISAKMKRDAIQRIVELYNSWDAADPEKGFNGKADEWSTMLTGVDPK